jgi:uncharacterized DUF497 family protein
MEFEWDRGKAAVNRRKHRVGFEEAVTVFADPLARIFDDPDHSMAEHREIIVGRSSRQRLLIVCFTERGSTVRIITARRASKQEQKSYEENA